MESVIGLLSLSDIGLIRQLGINGSPIDSPQPRRLKKIAPADVFQKGISREGAWIGHLRQLQRVDALSMRFSMRRGCAKPL
jgi:hypothetical protein